MEQQCFPTSLQHACAIDNQYVNVFVLFTFRYNLDKKHYFLFATISISGVELITIFQETPLLPTYLFGLVISQFAVSNTSSGEISFAVLSRPEQTINTQFALETGTKALELYESAFETKYELEKLDQVALPGFNRGSMENHGIIFYDEGVLLVEPRVSALRT